MNVMTEIPIREHANAAGLNLGTPVISILIPFFKDDPRPLLAALAPLTRQQDDFEIILFDDGQPDTALNQAVCDHINTYNLPIRLLTSVRNRGRAAGRNLLAAAARGAWLLYLDADMSPADDRFLDRYRAVITEASADAYFGGYETCAPETPALRLHAALSRSSDQHAAADRNKIGATAFCSSNLLVRSEVMQACPYDEGFSGWGWEDVDWAVTAAHDFRLSHIHNPARHGGLQTADALLAKFRAGAVNFKRLLQRHPELAGLPGARAARMLGRLPGQHWLRGVWSFLCRCDGMPMRVRTLALKLWRASWTSEALR